MKTMYFSKFALALVFAVPGLCQTSCSSSESKENVALSSEELAMAVDYPDPPLTWQEHWFEHNQLVKRVFFDDHLALYFDDDVDRSVTWPNVLLSDVWVYVKNTYGSFGDDPRLFTVLHTGRYSGGHPSTYFDASHDYRNVIDCGPFTWTEETPAGGISMLVHEVGHIVEGAAKGIKESPAWDIWKDSKWAEIFIYDVYKNLGKDDFAQQVYDDMMGQYDNFPRENTQWFKDWFYPIYSQYGEEIVLNGFFDLLAAHFPKTADGKSYSRRMNWGEFIHFWSGAAGTDLKPLAQNAFGWSDEWENQLTEAKSTFHRITY
ncbi:hypothetical protein [Sinomicrobium sp. M5D2P9]